MVRIAKTRIDCNDKWILMKFVDQFHGFIKIFSMNRKLQSTINRIYREIHKRLTN